MLKYRRYKYADANKFHNLEKMNKFWETQSPPNLNQDEIYNLNRLTSKSVIKPVKEEKKEHLSANKVQDQIAPQANSNKYTKKKS